MTALLVKAEQRFGLFQSPCGTIFINQLEMDKIPTRHNSVFGDEWSIKNTDLSIERLRTLVANEFSRNLPLQSILGSLPVAEDCLLVDIDLK